MRSGFFPVLVSFSSSSSSISRERALDMDGHSRSGGEGGEDSNMGVFNCLSQRIRKTNLFVTFQYRHLIPDQ